MQSQDWTIRGECEGAGVGWGWHLLHPIILSTYTNTTCNISTFYFRLVLGYQFSFGFWICLQLILAVPLTKASMVSRCDTLQLDNFKKLIMKISFLMNIQGVTSLCLCVGCEHKELLIQLGWRACVLRSGAPILPWRVWILHPGPIRSQSQLWESLQNCRVRGRSSRLCPLPRNVFISVVIRLIPRVLIVEDGKWIYGHIFFSNVMYILVTSLWLSC